jgi:two-component system, OmpR family, sensor histidine kinase ChvG
MASVTVTAKPERAPRGAGRRWRLPGSRLGRLIVALNLLGLAILIVGALVLNELRRGLITAEIQGLTTQGRGIVHVIEEAATVDTPKLDDDIARETLQVLLIQDTQRARIWDDRGQLVADSYVLNDHIVSEKLPPAGKPGEFQFHWDFFKRQSQPEAAQAQAALASEVQQALQGQTFSGVRRTEAGQVVSVSIPIQRVQAVVGVLRWSPATSTRSSPTSGARCCPLSSSRSR